MDSKENLEQTVQDVTGVSSNAPAPVIQKNDVVFQDKPKKNKGLLIGMILFAVLAVGGVGFGVWAMMGGEKTNQQLNSEISDLKRRTDDLEENNEELTDQMVDENEGNDEVDEKTFDGYLVIKEWGYKVKIPEGLKNVDYRFENDRVYVVGIVSEEPVEEEDLPMFADFSRNEEGLTVVERLVDDGKSECTYKLLFYDENYSYCSGIVGADTESKKYSEGETTTRFFDSIETVRKMMRNKENYTKL